jgi:hypothetical protein
MNFETEALFDELAYNVLVPSIKNENEQNISKWLSMKKLTKEEDVEKYLKTIKNLYTKARIKNFFNLYNYVYVKDSNPNPTYKVTTLKDWRDMFLLKSFTFKVEKKDGSEKFILKIHAVNYECALLNPGLVGVLINKKLNELAKVKGFFVKIEKVFVIRNKFYNVPGLWSHDSKIVTTTTDPLHSYELLIVERLEYIDKTLFDGSPMKAKDMSIFIRDIYRQVIYVLLIAKQKLDFRHGDFHLGNIMKAKSKDFELSYGEETYKFTSEEIKIIDFEFSYVREDKLKLDEGVIEKSTEEEILNKYKKSKDDYLKEHYGRDPDKLFRSSFYYDYEKSRGDLSDINKLTNSLLFSKTNNLLKLFRAQSSDKDIKKIAGFFGKVYKIPGFEDEKFIEIFKFYHFKSSQDKLAINILDVLKNYIIPIKFNKKKKKVSEIVESYSTSQKTIFLMKIIKLFLFSKEKLIDEEKKDLEKLWKDDFLKDDKEGEEEEEGEGEGEGESIL